MVELLANSFLQDDGAETREEITGIRRHQVLSRTIAILAGVAASTHQLSIQALITQNGFSILSERVELWSLETDQDFLQEFLRDEKKRMIWMHRLTGAKIYVMVLERHDAAETWLRLCGPDLEGNEDILGDDGLPMDNLGLRARYGAGVVYGSTVESAPRQLAICFPDLASVAALDTLHAEIEPLAINETGSYVAPGDESIDYEVYDSTIKPLHSKEELGSPEHQVANLRSPPATDKTDEVKFKARPAPSSSRQPTIKPRLSKAAALRMGIAIPEPAKRTMSNASSNDASVGISGLPRPVVALPKSLAAPSITPRLNRASSVRTKTISSSESDTAIMTRKPIDFSNTPGHKRLSVSSSRPASLAAPAVAPRLNKATTARLSSVNGNDVVNGSPRSATVSSTVSPVNLRKPIDFSNTPGHKRMSLTTNAIKSLQPPTLAPRARLASQARTSVSGDAFKPAGNGTKNLKSIVKEKVEHGKENEARSPIDFSNTPGHKRSSSNFAISSLKAPSITPRSNAAATKRLSVGGVTRPAGNTLQSRGSMPAAHQDEVVFPRTTVRSSAARAAPPSSFRL